MEIYISEFSKYVIALLIALYTFECFAVFRYEDVRGGREFISDRVFGCLSCIFPVLS